MEMGWVVGHVFGDHVANVVESGGNDVSCLCYIRKHRTPQLRNKRVNQSFSSMIYRVDECVLTSSNVPVNDPEGGFGLMGGRRSGSGSMLLQASL